jgi:TRAP-type mannitol/chloroaromatic compound transport system permease large subunit
MNKISQALITTSIALGSLGVANVALAAYPTTVTGTWNGFANQTVVRISITQFPSTSACKPIAGTMTNATSTISGIYCPSSGLISFKRSFGSSVSQVYVGNLSEIGPVLRMTGTFISFGGPGGTPGEYSFSVSR